MALPLLLGWNVAVMSGQSHITINGAESQNGNSWDSGTITVTVNSYSRTLSYGQYSTAASIASGLAALFSRDCNSPAIAHAQGASITFAPRIQGASLGTISGSASGSYNSFTLDTSGGTGGGGGGAPSQNFVVTSLSLPGGPPNMGFVIFGQGFGASQPSGSSVTIGGTVLTILNWGSSCNAVLPSGANSCITVQVPAGAAPGISSVQVNIPGSSGSSNISFHITTPYPCPN